MAHPAAYFEEIGLLKNACILAVIFLHACMPYGEPILFWSVYADEPVHAVQTLLVFSGFLVIPSLFFASGFLLGERIAEPGKKMLLKRRALRLLLPWLAVSLLWMLPFYCFFDLPALNRPAGLPLSDTFLMVVSGRMTEHLWFLLVLFWVTLFWVALFPFVKKGRVITGLLMAFSAGFLVHHFGQYLSWFALWEVTGPLVYFYLGIIFRQHRFILPHLGLRIAVTVLALLLLLSIYLTGWAHDEILSWLMSAGGAIAVYLLFREITPSFSARFSRWRAYRFFDAHAFAFYLLHFPIGILIFRFASHVLMLRPAFVISLAFILNLLLTGAAILAILAAWKKLRKLMPGKTAV